METIVTLRDHQSPKDGTTRMSVSKLLIMLSAGGVFALLSAASILWILYATPRGFQNNTLFSVEKGQTVREVARRLDEHSIISSPFLFRVYVTLKGCAKTLREGEYLFVHGHSLGVVVDRMCTGDFGVSSVRVLLREGLARTEIAETLKKTLPFFDEQEFLERTQNQEGYLFPDTYIFYKTATAQTVAETLYSNFEKKTEPIKAMAASQGRNWEEVVIVASLLETEGKTEEDKRMIADIIYRRLHMGMPLQLDAPFLYFMNKASLQLTKDDLMVDSPYNTYRHKGLPPTPIASPGLESLRAALNPKKNTHVYYLSDASGNIYYADTFEQHKRNKQKYLR